ncbi:DNA replication and repair protein RecF [termite gut metagenome]|uniref:DNA replication and repair protein RecF n=1 Tax=termite gut metagenome TaxID=433724 RepID=A0A5J4RMT4_9ZZZZ
MIHKIELNNFKSHKDTKLEFSNLTVLCGANSSGKSSVIQALLLLRESFFNKSQFDYLDLKTKPVSIGTIQDALYQFSDNKEISFSIETSNGKNTFAFELRDKDYSKTLLHKSKHDINYAELEQESLFQKTCQFISAVRLGPQVSYLKNDRLDINNQISEIEWKAENVVQFLDKKRYQDVIPEICISSYDNDLFTQVTAWEREISSGVNVVVEDKGQLGYELKYQFNTKTGRTGRTDKFNAINVGFGLTYALPVIVVILSAMPNESILFIENPEAHLHPRGQAKLAELICLAAQAGIQIVIETHSDHIINGILVQCKIFEEQRTGISKDNVSVYYLNMDGEKHCSIAKKINILEGGKIDKQPAGFFDQIEHDLSIIMGF